MNITHYPNKTDQQGSASALYDTLFPKKTASDKQEPARISLLDKADISEDALLALNKAQFSEKTQSLLKSSGEKIFRTLLDQSSNAATPSNLAARLDNEAGLTSQQKSEIANQISQREFDAFGKYAQQSPPDLKNYYENYINYLDSLSPEERNSERYKGQRELAIPLYEAEAQKQGEEPKDFNKSGSTSTLLDALREHDFNIEEKAQFKARIHNDPNIDSDNLLSLFERAQSVVDNAKNGNAHAFNRLEQIAFNSN
ncbi:hypothetical protein [Alteromonas sp. a30]|uniref:hypothetical protein n=1 Tax=Alteromonas sp. a30 TaxID=2730917 RepID=UPI00227F6010|nr:hypothetical protein [Alteromonas sp. a30]MCY7295505.1 hypothetical protein [Alteromonas sp. a30]